MKLNRIILIFIGITLAIAFNNWNDERKSKAQGKVYLGEIYNDIQKEIVNIDEAIALLKDQEGSAKYLLSVMESGGVVLDSFKFIQSEITVVKMVEVSRNQSTWDELSASGTLKLLSDEKLKEMLLEYYTQFDYRANNFNEVPRNMRMKARSIGGICFDLESIERFHYGGFKEPPTSYWFSCWNNNDEIFGVIRAILVTCYWNIPWFEDVKVKAQFITSYIEENYPDVLSHG